jgi:hypothetical protein
MGNNRNPNGASNRKRNGKRKYHQGFYTIKNPQKYIGDVTKCIYRSKWELYFMTWCDNETSIKRWSSEFITIPYQDEFGHFHRYFPDFYIEIIDKKNPLRFDQVVVEIKPFKETQMPKMPANPTAKSMESFEYQLKTYQKNLYKWTKAQYWCEKNHMKFVLIHEYILQEKKIM